MRILHTADWHIGKVLKGLSRLDEQREVLAEVVDVARRERVDAVLVAGDVFDSGAPTAEAQTLAWSTLLALRAVASHVVVVAGNHDPADLFDALAPVFAPLGVVLRGRIRRPADGGVVELGVGGERLRLALVPFVSQRGVVRAGDLLELSGAEMAGAYAERLGAVTAALTAGFDGDAVNVVLAHMTVRGGMLGGGERDAQTAFEYTVPATVFPPSATYVALGHLHRQQEMAAGCPVRYPGSPFAVDFGEETDAKGVLVVDAAPGRPAVVRPVPLTRPRRLRTIRGSFEDLRSRAGETGDDLLRVVVEGPSRSGLADEVRVLFPRALEVRVDHPAGAAAAVARRSLATRTPAELFAAYCELQGIDDPRLAALFGELLDAELAGDGR